MKYVLLFVPTFLVLACGDDPAPAPTYGELCATRNTECGSNGADKPDDCSQDLACYTDIFTTEVRDQILTCLSSRACNEARESKCLRSAANEALKDKATKEFVDKCDARATDCNFSDKYCQDEAALFSNKIRVTYEGCFARDCAEVEECFKGAHPSCTF